MDICFPLVLFRVFSSCFVCSSFVSQSFEEGLRSEGGNCDGFSWVPFPALLTLGDAL